MIYSYAYCRMVFFTDIDEWNESILNLLQLLRILFVSIFKLFECSSWVHIITWIDAYFLCIECCYVCNIRIEMNVCTQRCVVASGSQLCIDMF